MVSSGVARYCEPLKRDAQLKNACTHKKARAPHLRRARGVGRKSTSKSERIMHRSGSQGGRGALQKVIAQRGAAQ